MEKNNNPGNKNNQNPQKKINTEYGNESELDTTKKNPNKEGK